MTDMDLSDAQGICTGGMPCAYMVGIWAVKRLDVQMAAQPYSQQQNQAGLRRYTWVQKEADFSIWQANEE